MYISQIHRQPECPEPPHSFGRSTESSAQCSPGKSVYIHHKGPLFFLSFFFLPSTKYNKSKAVSSCWVNLFSAFVRAESRFSPSGRPFQAAGLGGAKGSALVQTPQEPRQTEHTHQVLREHVGLRLSSSPLTSLQARTTVLFFLCVCVCVCVCVCEFSILYYQVYALTSCPFVAHSKRAQIVVSNCALRS